MGDVQKHRGNVIYVQFNTIYAIDTHTQLSLVSTEEQKTKLTSSCNVSFSLLCIIVVPQNISVSLNRPSLCVCDGHRRPLRCNVTRV